MRTVGEGHSCWGRSDIEAEINGRHYVVELKVAQGKELSEKAADEAIKQIHEKGYADKYAAHAPVGAALIGLAVDSAARRVGGYRIEALVNSSRSNTPVPNILPNPHL